MFVNRSGTMVRRLAECDSYRAEKTECKAVREESREPERRGVRLRTIQLAEQRAVGAPQREHVGADVFGALRCM